MVIEKTQERIENCLNEGEGLRLNEKSFTRKGKLGAKRILHLIRKRQIEMPISAFLFLYRYFFNADILKYLPQNNHVSRRISALIISGHKAS